MPALPILKFPTLVLKKILRSIDIDTVFPISLCSRKMYYLVKNFRDKTDPIRVLVDGKRSNIYVSVPENGFTVYVAPITENSKTAESVNINGHRVSMDRSRKHHVSTTYWNDDIQGIPTVYEYLLELLEFKCAPEVVVSRKTLWLLSYIEKRQGDNYHLVIEDLTKEVCHFILKDYHPQVVRILSLPNNFPITQYMNSIESLIADSQLSLTLNDVLNTNCVELVLWEIHFTSTEVKRILQHWAIGGFKRLKYLGLYVTGMNLEDVFEELAHTQMTEKREYKSNIEDATFSDRLITRNDGVVASFRYDEQYGRVEFGVWPDSEGNQY
ncbi:hypothetical protein GCK72_015828 [Caenorhabditis remanei]|uniref:F-box domain-containing protein n=1 Tax=Caenorhabditis remanei TaxID=31234 RepID=A0A6A5GXH6_CAERE|nr:hypothetical protein GCK72_015828 [Caenorhabditis remanei]KAF1759361.1 hypothetical protein GCK72_015828 [Caenorhabditis remanei]